MKKIALLFLMSLLVLVSCAKGKENLSSETEKKLVEKASEGKNTGENKEKNNEEGKKEQPFLREITYSNLLDEESQAYTKKQLLNAGIKEKSVERFLKQVNDFNSTVSTDGFVKKGFTTSKELSPVYDQAKIAEDWDKKKAPFIGNNCRITTFGLLHDLILVGDPGAEKDASNLLMDEDSLNTNPEVLFQEKERECFRSFFSYVETEYTKDIGTHLKHIREDRKRKKISFDSDGKATMVSVIFHSALMESENYVFIGHVGVLVPTEDGKFLFIEKIAFDEPYQAIIFKNKTEVSDFLMNRYDTEWDQPTAPPFVMENEELIEGFRRKPR